MTSRPCEDCGGVGGHTARCPRKVTVFAGAAPTECQLCRKPIQGAFVDGATRFGPWAFMCIRCHVMHGCGLGTGRGQRYTQQSDGAWIKTGG